MTYLPKIPGYRIIKKLGQGGMADVYLGIQEKLQRQVAIKVMIPSLFRDEQFSTRFIKEAQTAAQLNHLNIITIHDVGETEDTHYIVMEYLEESLSNRLYQQGSIPPKEALNIVKMIAAALDYAHKKGFIHRDIKPDNIMFRADGTVVLVDFGIARAIDSSTHLTRTGMSIGTPHYMSPEQCKGEKIDGRSDIYSLGVQLYEMLTGEVPYSAENTAGIIIKHIQDPVPKLPRPLSQYQPLINKLMAKEKNVRVQTGEELIKFIEGFLTAQEFMPPPATVPETLTMKLDKVTVPTPRPSRVPAGAATVAEVAEPLPGKKWLVPGLVIALVVLLGAVAIYFITLKPPPAGDKTGTDAVATIDSQETKPPLGKEKESGTAITPKETTTPQEKGKEEQEETKTKPGEDTPAGIEKGKEGKDSAAADTRGKTPKEEETLANKDKSPDQGKVDIIKKETTPAREGQKPTEQKTENRGLTPEPGQEKKTPLYQPERKIPPPAVKTVNLLEVDPNILQIYSTMSQRIQIALLNTRFQVHGQIVLNLFINEYGRVTVLSLDELLEVQPPPRKIQVITAIKRKINNTTLPAPKDKKGNSVRFNWRVTFKVGLYQNRLILIKQ